jgi:hypothetical protein
MSRPFLPCPRTHGTLARSGTEETPEVGNEVYVLEKYGAGEWD